MALVVLKLEFIAENYFEYIRLREQGKIKIPHEATEAYRELLGRDKSRPWVARITGRDERFGLKRKFERARKDYSQANKLGTRGVFLYYHLTPGIYEVNEREVWDRVRRYFVRVEGPCYQEISSEEVEAWLNQGGESSQISRKIEKGGNP